MSKTEQKLSSRLPRIIRIFLLLLCCISFVGCHNKPVRHLTSDVSMLEKGVSTEEDVLVFLGNPDWQEQDENGITRWIYQNNHKSFAQKLPFAGDSFGEQGHTVVIISLQNNIVSDIEYHTTAPNELGWQRSRQ